MYCCQRASLIIDRVFFFFSRNAAGIIVEFRRWNVASVETTGNSKNQLVDLLFFCQTLNAKEGFMGREETWQPSVHRGK